ncbi:MAG: integron integrase [Candidatus Electrothrix sp. AR3]|nr:integron integrase [Candidatus Electrothrix sp. AR3]
MENKKSKQKFRPNPKLKLMEQVHEVLRYHHYAYKTEQTYSQWILRYIHFFECKTHPAELGSQDIKRFLSHLAIERKVSASTQCQALNALIVFYRDVLDIPLDEEIQPIRSKKKPNLPTVLRREEIQRFFHHINGTHALMAKLLYGSGLRLMECVRLRIKDVDFDRKRIHVLGKGGKQRSTILAEPIIPELQRHIERVKTMHHTDLEEGFGEVYIPEALLRNSAAAKETRWQYVFSGSGCLRRRKRRDHHPGLLSKISFKGQADDLGGGQL